MQFLSGNWRRLFKHKTFGFINIPGLAIGMAGAVLIFMWVRNEYSYDRFRPDGEHIYMVNWHSKDGAQQWDGSPNLLAEAAREEIPSIVQTTRYHMPGGSDQTLHIGDQYVKEDRVVKIDRNWFDFWHYEFQQGNAMDFNRDINGVVLTASMAKKYFGNEPCLGKIIQVDTTVYQIKGIVKDNPNNSSFQFDFFFPIRESVESKDPANAWSLYLTKTFIQISPFSTLAKATASIQGLINRRNPGDPSVLSLLALENLHFDGNAQSQEINHGNRTVVLILTLIGVLLLSIACINYINLTTARAADRVKEVSIRKMIGADRRGLFLQFIGETVFTGTLALILTIVLVVTGLHPFNTFTGQHFSLWTDAVPFWGILAGTWVISILLTSIYPALLLSSFQTGNLLSSARRSSPKHALLRKSLVVIQFTIAIVLMIATLVIFRQLHFMESQQEGYDQSRIFAMNLPRERSNPKAPQLPGQRMHAFTQSLLQLTGIEHATVVNGSILNMNMSMSGIADWAGRDPSINPSVYLLGIDSGFQKIFPLQLREGRWFQPGSTADAHNYVLNETSVADFGLHAPYIGQRLILMGDTGQIIGIVRDFHFRSYRERIQPLIMVADPAWRNTVYVQFSPGLAAQTLKTTQGLWNQYFPQSPFNATFLDDSFNQLYRSDIMTSRLIAIFAIVAIMLSCLGLYGLAAFSGEQRTKEIGIRKVLGASVQQIVLLLSGDFMKLVCISLIVASPIAWWAMDKWLQGFVYHVGVAWWIFAISWFTAAMIAIVSVSYQAISSAIANPVDSLRAE